MKRFLTIFALIFSVAFTNAQKNIFVLVDVSKSVKSNQLDNAKTALREIFTTGNVANGTVVGGNSSDLQFYKLQTNDRVSVNVFGDLQTSANIIPILKTIINPANEIDIIINSIAWIPRNNWTYLTLARAKIAEFAKNRQINNYLLIEITDNVNDDYGPNGSANYQGKTYLEDLITQYNTTTNKVTDNGWTKVAFGSDKKFLLSLTSGVNISKYTPPTFQATTDGITITYPSQTKKGAEYEINNASFTLTWTCIKCNPNIEYSVSVEGYDGNTYTEHFDNIKNEATLLNLNQNGNYQIIVSARNCNLIPDTAYVKLNIIKDNKIKITSPIGTKKKPNEIKGQRINVSWSCPDCEENTTFTVSVAGTDGNKNKAKPIKTKNFSASFNELPRGNYRITVSGTNGSSSDTTYIKVSSGGGAGIFLFILFLIALGVGGYLLIKKMKNKKPIQNSSENNYENNNNPTKNDSKNNNSVDTADDGMF